MDFLNHKKELTNILCQLFLFILFIASFSACNSSQVELNDAFYKNYILEDQGAEPNDTSFSFNIYAHDITGDQIADPLYITTYMDNYFGYIFNGETGKEIPQSGWVNFISKPGREMHLEFRDLTCDEGNEIVQYSISGQQNNEVHFDILSFKEDSLINVFSKELTWRNERMEDYSFYYSLLPDSTNCGVIRFQNNFELLDSIQNKIEYILETEPRPLFTPILSGSKKRPINFKYNSEEKKFIKQ